MSLIVLIDYDNLLPTQKSAGILSIVTNVLMKLPKVAKLAKAKCDVRIYGGWYEGSVITKVAQELAVSLQSDFPSVIRVRADENLITSIWINAELATSLIEEPNHHLFDTFRRKGRPNNIRVVKPVDIGCTDPACILPAVASILRKGKCPIPTCGKTELVYRSEQKLVDTMLTCDLVYSSQSQFDHIILISSDDDFIPPIRTLMSRGAKITRVHPKFSTTRKPIKVAAHYLNEMEL